MRKSLLTFIFIPFALAANATTYYWTGASNVQTAAAWSLDASGSPTLSAVLDFSSSDVYDRATSVATSTTVLNFGTSINGKVYGTFRNSGLGTIDAYWSGNSAITITAIDQNTAVSTSTRAASGATGLSISVGTINVSAGIYNLGNMSKAGVSAGTLTSAATVTGGTWNIFLCNANYASGTFTSTDALITQSAGTININSSDMTGSSGYGSISANIGRVNMSGGTMNVGVSACGMSSAVFTGATSITGGQLSVVLGNSVVNSGTMTATGATFAISAGELIVRKSTNYNGTAALGDVSLSGTSSMAKLSLGYTSSLTISSFTVNKLTVTNSNNYANMYASSSNGSISTLVLDATSAASVLKVQGTEQTTLNIGDLQVKGSNGATLSAEWALGNLMHLKMNSINLEAGATLAVSTLNRNITVGAMSFDLAGADTGSALLTIATGTGALLASGDYIALDFANAEAATTYLVVSNSKVMDLADFYVDSAKGSLSLSADGTSLYFTSVPEPAEWAAIFGALALGFALYARRRK